MQFVIPGLTRNPVTFWIPAFAGMTRFVAINDAVYSCEEDGLPGCRGCSLPWGNNFFC